MSVLPARTRVLLCEDNPDVRYLLRVTLEDHGFEIIGEAGDCTTCERQADTLLPDVVLLDLGMPGGVTELECIGRLNHPVVVFSGFPEGYKARECLDAGAAAYVQKDADPSHLVAVLRSVAS